MATIISPRPISQSSIQSSNSGIINGNAYNPIQDDEIVYNQEDLELNRIAIPADTSPLFFEFKSSEVDDLTTSDVFYDSHVDSSIVEINFKELLNELPSSCVPFAFLKLSTSEFNSINGLSTNDYSDYTSSSKLSPQLVLNYSELSPRMKKSFNRKKVIEEIIETEESYISSLKMLSGIYLDSIINKGNNGIPIKMLLDYTDLLVLSHEDFLNDLRKLYAISISNLHRFEISEISKHLISSTSPLMSALVAELINKKAISIYIYQEYYSLVDLVLKLINSKIKDPELGENLIKGYQMFLESSSFEKLDLSLISLIHKPVQRISKYKLFLESLLNLTNLEEDELSNKKIKDCLIQIDYSIKEINRYGLQEKIKSISLFNNLNFNTELKFPVEYLGLPLLLGSSNVVYISNEELMPKSFNYGVFLFKTHLILCDVTNKFNKFDVIFLIPLSVSKIISMDDEFDDKGGIFTNYGNSFKILFENNFAKYELLFLNFNEHENSIWKEKLSILINVVNGPYRFDYSSSYFNEEQGTTSSTIIPSNIQSFDVKLDKFIQSNKKSIFNKCYFQKVILIEVEIDNEENYHHHYSYSSKRFKQLNFNKIYLKQFERTKIEFILEDLWSDELISLSSMLLRKKLKKKSVAKNGSKKNNSITDQNLSNSSSIRMSIMRRTSSVFGDALRSIFNIE